MFTTKAYNNEINISLFINNCVITLCYYFVYNVIIKIKLLKPFITELLK